MTCEANLRGEATGIHINRLESIQKKALRTTKDALRFIESTQLKRDLEIETIKEEIIGRS